MRKLGKVIARGFGAVTLFALAACSPIQIGSRVLDFGGGGEAQSMPMQPAMAPAGPAQSFGHGPVQVALLLPLSGDAGLAQVGQSLANASRLAIAFIEANPNIAENITISLRDTGSTVAGATAAASAALASGAKLVLGPLKADAVMAVGAVARASGVPVIGFSNTPSAASPGVYLLSVLPDMEMKRSLNWIKSQGRRGIAGVFPSTEFGQAQEVAFRQQAVIAGFAPSAVYTFSSASEAKQIIDQALPQIQKGMIDTLYLPDRSTAPSFGVLLAQAGVTPDMVQIVGSADWEGDPTIATASQLNGAIYPAVDPAGMAAISGDYQRQFGSRPHALATIAYTATILANVNTLSMATPPYNPVLMTSAQGFNGRDGVFRFLGNGRAEYALVIKKNAPGGAQIIETAGL
jgi:ABC-type branched-subunit amino acid transport system substrate-binding protein